MQCGAAFIYHFDLCSTLAAMVRGGKQMRQNVHVGMPFNKDGWWSAAHRAFDVQKFAKNECDSNATNIQTTFR
jgi:hypothetical protein